MDEHERALKEARARLAAYDDAEWRDELESAECAEVSATSYAALAMLRAAACAARLDEATPAEREAILGEVLSRCGGGVEDPDDNDDRRDDEDTSITDIEARLFLAEDGLERARKNGSDRTKALEQARDQYLARLCALLEVSEEEWRTASPEQREELIADNRPDAERRAFKTRYRRLYSAEHQVRLASIEDGVSKMAHAVNRLREAGSLRGFAHRIFEMFAEMAWTHNLQVQSLITPTAWLDVQWWNVTRVPTPSRRGAASIRGLRAERKSKIDTLAAMFRERAARDLERAWDKGEIDALAAKLGERAARDLERAWDKGRIDALAAKFGERAARDLERAWNAAMEMAVRRILDGKSVSRAQPMGKRQARQARSRNRGNRVPAVGRGTRFQR